MTSWLRLRSAKFTSLLEALEPCDIFSPVEPFYNISIFRPRPHFTGDTNQKKNIAFISTVSPTVYTNPSENGTFTKRYWTEGIWKRALWVVVSLEYAWKTDFFKKKWWHCVNDGIWSISLTEIFLKHISKGQVIYAFFFSNSSGGADADGKHFMRFKLSTPFLNFFSVVWTRPQDLCLRKWLIIIINNKRWMFTYITLLFSLSTSQAPKPSRVNLYSSFSNTFIIFV